MEWLPLAKMEEEKYLADLHKQREYLAEKQYQDTFDDWWNNYKN